MKSDLRPNSTRLWSRKHIGHWYFLRVEICIRGEEQAASFCSGDVIAQGDSSHELRMELPNSTSWMAGTSAPVDCVRMDALSEAVHTRDGALASVFPETAEARADSCK